MKNNIIILIGLIQILTSNCKNEQEPVLTPSAVLTTSAVTSITQTSAISGGNVTSEGGSTVTERGVCWSTGTTPTIADSKTIDGTGVGNFISSIIGLTANTTYSVRAYATNSTGTGYGDVKSFTTIQGATVTDMDGNVYQTVIIGTQEWIAENLKTTKYNDGTTIPLVTDNTEWSNLITGGYCWLGNNETQGKATYGALYNWYTVDTGKLCPTGWHVPTNGEWTTLTSYLGGASVAGGKLKEIGMGHWLSPNEGATNESGFTALPGSGRGMDGAFGTMGGGGAWWSSTEESASLAWLRSMANTYAGVNQFSDNKKFGLSVRCLKD